MPCANLRFLIAEDHAFQRGEWLRTLLSLGAQTVHQAADGHGALSILRDLNRPVDIVISDLDMVGMDGMEFVRHLGESGASVSIILASALERKLLASIATMAQAYGIRLLGVVEKPLTPRKLLPLIKLHQTAYLPPIAPSTADIPSFSRAEILTGLHHDQFEPYFQPKIELASGRFMGAEALARWLHPQLGVIGPECFIELMEADGLIDELTWIMLRKSAASCRAWRANGLNASVSVNLSLFSLSDLNIATRVAELLHSQDLNPTHMILEITESGATTDVGKTLENLARLRMKGFGLSIDDYGTGYSSMQQLSRIAFTELKIDRHFVVNANKDPTALVILESSLRMARKLNIQSVAEGVETRADFDLLSRLHCDMAQGYFIARPMPYADLLSWDRKWTVLGESAPQWVEANA